MADPQRNHSASGSKGPASATTKKDSVTKNDSCRTTRSSSASGEKKAPPIKAPVWNAPPPNIKQAKSKIGSLDNVTHKPKGGERKVESVKLEWNVKSKVGSLDYATHKPGGGEKKITSQKLDFKNVQSRVGSKDNIKHKPGGGNVKVANEKLEFKEKAASRVGSLDNAAHKPGGGNVVIRSEKVVFKDKSAASSRGGSEVGSPVQAAERETPMPPLTEDAPADPTDC